MAIHLYMEENQGSAPLQTFKTAVIGVFRVFLIHGMRFCIFFCNLIDTKPVFISYNFLPVWSLLASLYILYFLKFFWGVL